MLKKCKKAALPALFLLVFIAEASFMAAGKSNTWDEPAHILAGYSYLREGMDYISPLNHPVFGRMLAGALPAAFLSLDLDRNVRPEEAPGSNFFPYSVRFLFENRTDGTTILFLSRLSNIVLGAVLGAYVYAWSSGLWGAGGGALSLFLYALCPNILAHSSLATTDLPVTAFFFITAFHLYRLNARDPAAGGAILTGAFFSLALTSKHTALLIAPLIAVSFFASLKKGPPKKVIIIYGLLLITAYLGVWAVYGFRYHSAASGYEPLMWKRFSSSPLAPAFALLRSVRFLPESYLYGLAGSLSGLSSGRAAFLMGMYSNTGWWYYFPVAFLIKTPIPALILLTASLLYLSRERAHRAKAAFIIFPVVMVFTAMSAQKVNIGLRHILPAYPFIFILIGYVTLIRTEAMRLAKAVFIGAVAWYAYANASIFPDQLAYFNEFTGGPKNGYRYLVDSNLDWGQDLPGLKRYMDKNGIERVKLAYFGLSDPAYYGIDYDYLPSYAIINPKKAEGDVELKGWFAISATMLQGVYLSDRDYYRVFRESKPDDTIGYSIFIYRF